MLQLSLPQQLTQKGLKLSEKVAVKVVMRSADPIPPSLECVWNLCDLNWAELKQDGGNVRIIQDLVCMMHVFKSQDSRHEHTVTCGGDHILQQLN